MLCHAGGQDLKAFSCCVSLSFIPGVVQEMPGCGTPCSGQGDKVGIGHSLNSMISEAFSSLNNSVILSLGGQSQRMVKTLGGPAEGGHVKHCVL